MNALKLSLLLPVIAILAVPLACSTEHGSGDAGRGGSDAGASGGSRGAGGANGSTGVGGAGGGAGAKGTGGAVVTGTGGRGGSGAGGHVDAGTSGAGGIILVDAAGNTFTCAQLLACCNSIASAQGKALCLQEYGTVMPQGNMACGNILAQIKANGVCP
jgi:hypothetical protein